MERAVPALAAVALGLRLSTDLLRTAAAALLLGAVLSTAEPHADLRVCDVQPGTITASHPGILEHLKLCPALTGAQRDALNAVLLGGRTAYGDPLSWDLQTLRSLGPLALALDWTTLSLVNKAVREAFGRSIAAAYSSQGQAQREKSLTLLTALAAASHPRLKRSTNRCLQAPITASVLSNSILLFDYESPEQFYLCLSNEVLQTDLALLLQQPLTTEYLWVVKKRLQEVYPAGLPEAQLRRLGLLSRLYTVQELRQWQVTSGDTLCVLLDPSAGRWSMAQRQQLIARFLELGGNLTGPLLQQIGGRGLCALSEGQIKKITPQAIRSAGKLDIATCSQTKKNQLYRTAQQAFASQAGTRVYYLQLQPYLGGAPAEDLKDLAEIGVDMDIATFLALNPYELQKLSVLDVKNLLGANIQQLKEAENHTAVICWVKKQPQKELDQILGIGLQGGMQEPRPTTSATATPAATVSTTTFLPAATTPTPTSSHLTNSNTSPKAPTPNAVSPTLPRTARPSTAVTAVTSAAQPAPTPGSTAPCTIHQPATSKAPAATLLTTILAAVNPNATSSSSVPPPAVTRGATTSTSVPSPTVTTRSTSTPLVSTSPVPAARNTTTPSTPSAPSALVPKSTAAPAAITATGTKPLPHKPTLIPTTTIPTQSVSSSTAKPTVFICKTRHPPAHLSPSPTSSSETTKKTPTGAAKPPRPPPDGHINIQPGVGSGSSGPRVSSCLLHILTTAVGISLLL